LAARTITTFTSRGRITGLIREQASAGTGQNNATRNEPARATIDEALYYRARLILGDFPCPSH
jgi:hypothetical protein